MDDEQSKPTLVERVAERFGNFARTKLYWLPDVVERVDNFGRGLANGLSLGFADHTAGIVKTPFVGGSVSDNVRSEVDRTNAAAASGPEVLAGELVGAARLGFLGLRFARSAFYREMVGEKVAANKLLPHPGAQATVLSVATNDVTNAAPLTTITGERDQSLLNKLYDRTLGNKPSM